MKQVSISLSEVDLRNVDTVAMDDSISRSGVIRRAVKDYFDRRAHGIDGLFDPDGTYRLMYELMKGFGQDSLAPWQRRDPQ